MRRKKLSKNNIKVERGITLIVLIITVITLLILAGITVTMLTGENGILIRASEASEQTRYATIKEEKDLWEFDKLVDEQTGSNTAETVEEIVNRLYENGTITEKEKDEILGNEEKGIEKTGKITIADKTIVFFEVEPYNIGDYVEYDVDYDDDSSVADDWRLFYKDENNIYLIASNYVSIDGLTKANEGGHILQLNIVESVTNIDTAIEFLQDTSYWGGLFGNNMSEYVIGGTTIELFAKSWNAKHPNEKIYLANTDQGVNAGMEENPTSLDIYSQENDDLYYLIKGDSTLGMWLSSKSGNYGYLIRTVNNGLGNIYNFTGELPGRPSGYSYIGVRPIICLKSNVNLVYGEGTIESPHTLEMNE